MALFDLKFRGTSTNKPTIKQFFGKMKNVGFSDSFCAEVDNSYVSVFAAAKAARNARLLVLSSTPDARSFLFFFEEKKPKSSFFRQRAARQHNNNNVFVEQLFQENRS